MDLKNAWQTMQWTDVENCLLLMEGEASLKFRTTLKMEATRSPETSVYSKPTRHHIPESGILH
jgi:hypothetical protein